MCARSDAGLQDEGELVPLRCSGFAPGCMCTFTVGNSQQQGIYQPNWCWAHPSRCQLQEGNLCLHYVTMLSCGRCWGSCRWAERQRDGILQAQQDPVPWANGLNWGGVGGQHAGSIMRVSGLCLWALPLRAAVVGEHKQRPLTLLAAGREHPGEQRLSVRGKAAPQPS